jgi:hypothetical protein
MTGLGPLTNGESITYFITGLSPSPYAAIAYDTPGPQEISAPDFNFPSECTTTSLPCTTYIAEADFGYSVQYTETPGFPTTRGFDAQYGATSGQLTNDAPVDTPEPTSMLILVTGLLGLGLSRKFVI